MITSKIPHRSLVSRMVQKFPIRVSYEGSVFLEEVPKKTPGRNISGVFWASPEVSGPYDDIPALVWAIDIVGIHAKTAASRLGITEGIKGRLESERRQLARKWRKVG